MNPADIAAGYLAALERQLVAAPRDVALIEAVLLWGLGIAAVGFMLTALVRRSPGAAVSFSLVTLTALIIGIATGRLGFLPTGTSTLVLCLYACAALLFLTACVRVARDNPLVGAGVLVAILGLVALGGGSALGMIDGAGLAGWAVIAVAAFALCAVLFDLARGDKAAAALAPGVALASSSPIPMLAVDPSSSPWLAASPITLLAVGTLLAATTALFVAAAPNAPVPKRQRRAHAPSYADDHAFFGEVDDVSSAPAPPSPILGGAGDRPPRPTGTPLFAPSVTGGAGAGGAAPGEIAGRGSYEPEPLEPSDPASSQWGGTDTVVPRAAPAADEYVWDAMSLPTLRGGADALAAFGVTDAAALPPEAIRAALAPGSLDAFDEQVLGGSAPRSGPFRAALSLSNGSRLTMDGTRQVDQDGILSRLSARIERDLAVPVLSAGPLRDGAAAALDRGEIGAHFQPIVKLSSRQTVGFEALARWTQASGEVLDAHAFVPDLIAAGRGLDLAERIAGEAARELAAWLSAQPGQGQFVSVNVSATDLDKKGLTRLVAHLVEEHGLPPGALVIELGEDRIKASSAAAMTAAKAIRQAGASLAVDDFGVGYSNLARLSKFRFDLVKTDRSLAAAAATDKKARQALKAVVQVARKSRIPVIAEGVEDEETARILEEVGCDFGQGYLFGRPEPAGGTGARAPQAAAGLR